MSTDDTTDTDDGQAKADSSQVRFWLTNDLTAFMLVLGYFAVIFAHGAGLIDVQALPDVYMSALVAYVGIAVAWAFGSGAVKAWRQSGGS